MRRAGGWILGLIAVAAMAVGAWIAFRPILSRETIRIAYLISTNARPPSSDAMISGARFAIKESGYKAGGYRIDLLVPSDSGDPPFDILISVDPDGVLRADIPSVQWRSSDPPPASPATVRVNADLDSEGWLVFEWARKTGMKRVTLLYDKSTANSERLCRSFEKAMKSDDMNREEPMDTAMNRAVLLDRVMTAQPDLVFYAGEAAPYGTAYDLFDALRKRGYGGRLVMGDADPEVSFLAVSSRVVDGTYLVSQIGPPSREFVAAYEPATGRRAGPHAWPAYQLTKEILSIINAQSSNRLMDLRVQADLVRMTPYPCFLYVAREGRFVFVQDLDLK